MYLEGDINRYDLKRDMFTHKVARQSIKNLESSEVGSGTTEVISPFSFLGVTLSSAALTKLITVAISYIDEGHSCRVFRNVYTSSPVSRMIHYCAQKKESHLLIMI